MECFIDNKAAHQMQVCGYQRGKGNGKEEGHRPQLKITINRYSLCHIIMNTKDLISNKRHVPSWPCHSLLIGYVLIRLLLVLRDIVNEGF